MTTNYLPTDVGHEVTFFIMYNSHELDQIVAQRVAMIDAAAGSSSSSTSSFAGLRQRWQKKGSNGGGGGSGGSVVGSIVPQHFGLLVRVCFIVVVLVVLAGIVRYWRQSSGLFGGGSGSGDASTEDGGVYDE
jgi:hypothetical protein